MYEKLNMTENHLQILILFTKSYDREYYVREVQKLLKISPRTAQLVLENLEKKGALKSKKRGKIKVYSLNKENDISRLYIILVEQYKLIIFLNKNKEIKHLLKGIKKILPNTCLVIFGSYAKSMQKKDSDLDILAITNEDFDKKYIEELEKMHTFKISIKTARIDKFDKNDIMVKEVLENHVILQKSELFIDLTW